MEELIVAALLETHQLNAHFEVTIGCLMRDRQFKRFASYEI